MYVCNSSSLWFSYVSSSIITKNSVKVNYNIYFISLWHNLQYQSNYMSIMLRIMSHVFWVANKRSHKTQKPLRRYSHGQKHCQICETFIEWDGTFCPCCGQKLRTREYISSEKTNLASNSIAKLVDHTKSKSNIEEPDVQTSYAKTLIHGHDFLCHCRYREYHSVDYVVRE